MAIATIESTIVQRLAREKLAIYGEFIHGWKAQAHHLRWIEALEDESIRRLLIIAAPAAAKTFWVGVGYSGWKIGKNPDTHLGYITYSDVVSFGRSTAIRDTLRTPRYQAVFPGVEPDGGKGWSQSHWYVKRPETGDVHPTLRACGLGSSIIAFRFDELICDDLCTQGNTHTEAERDKSWAWWQSTLMTRLVPGGRVVYIGTRWHEDDLPSHLMQQVDDKGKPLWKVLHIPAIADGNSYWPGFWPIDRLLEKKEEMGSDAFNCQYQGAPVAAGGNILRWFNEYEHLPPLVAKVHFWDTAYLKKEQADYSACTTWGYGEDGLIYCLGAYQDRLEFPELCDAIEALAAQDHPTYIFVEARASGTSAFQEIRSRTGLPVIAVSYTGNQDKVARANAVAPYLESGKVLFPKEDRPWKQMLISQLKSFPRGRHDDLVDTSVGAILQIVERIGRPELKPIPLRY